MTATNTWPFPDRPGVPLHPEKDGWHWLEDTVDGVGTGHIEVVYYAAWSVPIWYRAGNRSPITKPKEWRYLGPCLTPEDIAAKDARIAELERLLSLADFWITGAIECKEWRWDADQHEAATHTRDEIRAALGGKDE